ncbi:release factor glutamine methyltransferase, partial [Phenoliferia sp. Uapishka_3]
MLPTPSTSHLSKNIDFESVYDPAESTEDTFVLLDALEQDALALKGSRLCLEIGSGSGCVSAFMGQICGPSSCLYLCTDLNPQAALCTLQTGKVNAVPLNPVISDLTSAFLPRLTNSVDVLVFNPPYVETEMEEMEGAQARGAIDTTWAGGEHGMTVTNRVLHGGLVETLLSDKGVFYLVTIQQNKPEQIIIDMRARGLVGEITLKRRAGGEHLQIIRFSRAAAT